MSDDVIKISCRDMCGNTVTAKNELELQGSGWTYLEITKSYRCPACWRGLRAASNIPGTSGETKDSLPPGSIGAIKKSTAHTILPPSKLS